MVSTSMQMPNVLTLTRPAALQASELQATTAPAPPPVPSETYQASAQALDPASASMGKSETRMLSAAAVGIAAGFGLAACAALVPGAAGMVAGGVAGGIGGSGVGFLAGVVADLTTSFMNPTSTFQKIGLAAGGIGGTVGGALLATSGLPPSVKIATLGVLGAAGAFYWANTFAKDHHFGS